MNTVYISGPMTWCENKNREAFRKAAELLKESGFEVINPHDFPEPDFPHNLTDAERWGRYLAYDLSLILEKKPDYIFMLPGWQCSRGACLERSFALMNGIPILPELAVKWSVEV